MLYIKLFIEREKNMGQSAPECPFKVESEAKTAAEIGRAKIDAAKADAKAARETERRRLEASKAEAEAKEKAETNRHRIEVEAKAKAEAEKLKVEAETVKARMEHEFRMREIEVRNRNLGAGGDAENVQDRDNNNGHGSRSAGMKALKLLPFNEEKDDLDAYLTRFERACVAFDVRPEHRSSQLARLLQGKALEVYQRLTDEEVDGYEFLKVQLLKP